MHRLITKTLLVTALAISMHAIYLPLKAFIAERLIKHSWQQSIKQQIEIKPWPWADTFAIAELNFQRLNQHIIVLNGGDPTTLAFSVGAVPPFNQIHSHQPIVIAGHKDTHFTFLKEVMMQDVISLTDKYGQGQLYIVEAVDIIDVTNGSLPIVADDKALILITCYPFSGASNSNERYVITARKLND